MADIDLRLKISIDECYQRRNIINNVQEKTKLCRTHSYKHFLKHLPYICLLSKNSPVFVFYAYFYFITGSFPGELAVFSSERFVTLWSNAVQSFKIPKPQSPVDFRAKTCWILEIFFNHKKASLSGSKRETKQKQRLVLPSPVLQSWYWKFRLTLMVLAKGVYFKETENPRSSVRLYICHNLSLTKFREVEAQASHFSSMHPYVSRSERRRLVYISLKLSAVFWDL